MPYLAMILLIVAILTGLFGSATPEAAFGAPLRIVAVVAGASFAVVAVLCFLRSRFGAGERDGA